MVRVKEGILTPNYLENEQFNFRFAKAFFPGLSRKWVTSWAPAAGRPGRAAIPPDDFAPVINPGTCSIRPETRQSANRKRVE